MVTLSIYGNGSELVMIERVFALCRYPCARFRIRRDVPVETAARPETWRDLSEVAWRFSHRILG